jgi:hypothetical protein
MPMCIPAGQVTTVGATQIKRLSQAGAVPAGQVV